MPHKTQVSSATRGEAPAPFHEHIVAQEQVVHLTRHTPYLQQLHQVVELPVNVAAHRHRRRNLHNVRLRAQQLLAALQKLFAAGLGPMGSEGTKRQHWALGRLGQMAHQTHPNRRLSRQPACGFSRSTRRDAVSGQGSPSMRARRAIFSPLAAKGREKAPPFSPGHPARLPLTRRGLTGEGAAKTGAEHA